MSEKDDVVSHYCVLWKMVLACFRARVLRVSRFPAILDKKPHSWFQLVRYCSVKRSKERVIECVFFFEQWTTLQASREMGILSTDTFYLRFNKFISKMYIYKARKIFSTDRVCQILLGSHSNLMTMGNRPVLQIAHFNWLKNSSKCCVSWYLIIFLLFRSGWRHF